MRGRVMGCAGNTSRSMLPVITTAFHAASGRAAESVAKTKAKRTTVVDFHCPQCGVTKPGYPNYRHKCPGNGDVWYQSQRQMICDSCPHNRDGKCLPLAAIHPGKPCIVDVGIPMPEVECPLKKWRRVLFKCQKCGSVRFNENGLTECPTCKPRPKPKMIIAPPVTDAAIESRRSDLAIISIATGQDATDLSAITFPRFERYADFVGADFIAVRDNRSPLYPLANKFRVGAITANYRRTIFLDSDVWLRSTVGNLFELFPPGRVWMHPDVERFPGEEWAIKRSEQLGIEQDIKPNFSRVFNTGVVIFDQEHRDIWSRPPKPMATDHVSEQVWIENQALNHGVGNLHWQFNCQWYWRNFRDLEPHAKVVHLANCPHTERMTRLRKLKETDADFI